MVFEPSLVADGDAAGGERLGAGQPEAPGGCFPRTLSQMSWLTGPASQSCFDEKPRGLSALWGTETRKSMDRAQLLPLLASWARELQVWDTR